MKDEKVDEYIGKQQSPQKEICIALRKLIFKNFPSIKEEMKWGVPAYDDGKYYFVALKAHVNLGFSINWLSKEKIATLQGSWKTMKIVEIRSIKEMDKKKIIELMKLIE